MGVHEADWSCVGLAGYYYLLVLYVYCTPGGGVTDRVGAG